MVDSELDRTLGMWDEQSCAEYEAWLDEVNDDVQDAEPPCTCYYTDVDVVENRYCKAHGKEFKRVR